MFNYLTARFQYLSNKTNLRPLSFILCQECTVEHGYPYAVLMAAKPFCLTVVRKNMAIKLFKRDKFDFLQKDPVRHDVKYRFENFV